MKRMFLAVLPVLVLSGAVQVQARPPVESITFETGACFGTCPVYQVTVRADGTGIFTGQRYTAVQGERRFRISRAQYRAFAGHLAPIRPRTGSINYADAAHCGDEATDLPGSSVVWQAGGRRQAVAFYYGCMNPQLRPIGARLGAAPGLLPIADFIGPRPSRR
jgi:hypothetical protein